MKLKYIMSAVVAVFMLSACSTEPDEANFYTFTGQTVGGFIEENAQQFSSFHYILQHAQIDQLLDSYGEYTCFLPDNQAVESYIDSLYDDSKNVSLPHNGMTSRGLEGLTDSLCQDIAKFHIVEKQVKVADFEASGTILNTMLGRLLSVTIADGKYLLNEKSTIVGDEQLMSNGVIHLVSRVVTRSNRLVATELAEDERYSIFSEALAVTGLSDSLTGIKKDITLSSTPSAESYYIPQNECKVGFTLFAESNDVLAEKANIHSLADLIEKCKEWYGKAAQGVKRTEEAGWYDYYRNSGMEVSTGSDYTSPLNVLNMFVRYHILKASLDPISLALDDSYNPNNGYSGDAYDYYETMLPKTLLKTWKVKSEGGKVYINRYVLNNTLTDKLPSYESMGSGTMHPLVYAGAEIDVDNKKQPLNGYIYPIKDILLYNAQVPMGVLNERMRIDVLSMLPEIMNNNFRSMHTNDLKPLNGNVDAWRVRFPVNFFDNVVVYNGNKTKIDMNVRSSGNSYALYKGDSFQGMGVYDFAIKLPAVPDGMYEIRIATTNFGAASGSMLQFYLGTSPDVKCMQAIDLPVDMRMDPYKVGDDRIVSLGYVPLDDETGYPEAYEDRGEASDKVMHNHGYMREGLSIVKESNKSFVSRYTAYQFRRIVKKVNLKQRDYWLRVKSVLPNESSRKFQLDYIEFCPISVYDNGTYVEDIY